MYEQVGGNSDRGGGGGFQNGYPYPYANSSGDICIYL